MKIKIEFKAQNAAWDQNYEHEIKNVCNQIEQYFLSTELNNSIIDSNGNTIGFIKKQF